MYTVMQVDFIFEAIFFSAILAMLRKAYRLSSWRIIEIIVKCLKNNKQSQSEPEPHHEKTCLRGLRPVKTRTDETS